MGEIAHAALRLRNPVCGDLLPLNVRAVADTRTTHLVIPRHVAIQLGLEVLEQREVALPDGTKRSVDYVGPIEVGFANRSCFVGALVLGNEVLLGAIPMEDMDLVVNPQLRQVTVNPDSPNMASGIVKIAA